nr:unnamed protein product [Spirometra erinaceieuropaei]
MMEDLNAGRLPKRICRRRALKGCEGETRRPVKNVSTKMTMKVAIDFFGIPSSFFLSDRDLQMLPRKVMFFLLDAEPSCDWADLIATFNTVFAPESSDAEVQAFRSQFAQLLVSPEDTEKFLHEVWKPQRESILATLAGISRSIIACLPITIFDKIGSREQALFDEFIRKFRTELSALILRVLASKQACTEQELLQITEEASKWTTPAV